MPRFFDNEEKIDKEEFSELKHRCALAGIDAKYDDFVREPDKYLEPLSEYEGKVKDYLYKNGKRFKELEERFAKDTAMPKFAAYARAKMAIENEAREALFAEKAVLCGQRVIDDEYNFALNELDKGDNRQKFEALAAAFGSSTEELSEKAEKFLSVKDFVKSQKDGRAAAFARLGINGDPALLKQAAVLAEEAGISNDDFINKAVYNRNGERKLSFLAEGWEKPLVKEEKLSGTEKLLDSFSRQKDLESGKNLLDISPKALTKKSNIAYFKSLKEELGITPRQERAFGIEFARYPGTLGEFIKNYDASANKAKKPQAENVSIAEKELEAKRKAEIDAARKELEAKRKAEEEAARKELEAKRKAEEEAAKKELEIKRKAEIERKKKETADKARIEADKKQKETEQRLKKELEAKRKAEEESERKKIEAKRKAEEEAARKELEAKRKAEEKNKEKELKRQKALEQAKEKELKKAEKEKARRTERERKAQDEAKAKEEKRQKALRKAKEKAKKEALEKEARLMKEKRRLLAKEKRKANRKAFFDKIKAKAKAFKAIIASAKFSRVQNKENRLALIPANEQIKEKRGFFVWLFKKKKKQEIQVLGRDKTAVDAKKAKIIAFKQKVREQGKKTLKYAAVGVPLATLGWWGYQTARDTKPVISFSDITFSSGKFQIAKNVMDTAEEYYAETANAFSSVFEGTPYDYISTELNFGASYKDRLPINEEDFGITVPMIKNDVLRHTPNVEFFNYCFSKSNERFGFDDWYGVSQQTIDDFMRHNRANAKLYGIKKHKGISYDEARIIAKTEVFDKYGIGYIKNKSTAAYLYNALISNENKGYVAAIATAVSDFYESSGMELSEKQSDALFKLSLDVGAVDVADWQQMVGAINAVASNPATEERLFAAMQSGTLSAPSRVPYFEQDETARAAYTNTLFAFEPTFETQPDANTTAFADNLFVSDILFNDNDEEMLRQQKDKDLEIFAKIFMQCSYDNFVKLSYGDKRQTFRDANAALKHYGIMTNIHQGLHCAGMSMASFCQAADIFTEQNPNSFVTTAIKEVLDNCRNVHSCGTLRDDLSGFTKSVVHSKNLEQDVKKHMEDNHKAILFVWAPRGGGRYHHQTLFQPLTKDSEDAYTYCAFNNNHWGNENTFANYMRSRARFGKSGDYADVGSGLDKIAEKALQAELKKRAEKQKKARADAYAKSLLRLDFKLKDF